MNQFEWVQNVFECGQWSHKDDRRAGASILWKQAEWVGAVQSGKGKTLGRLYSGLPAHLKGPYRKAGPVRENGFKLKKGRLRLDIREKFFTQRVVCTLQLKYIAAQKNKPDERKKKILLKITDPTSFMLLNNFLMTSDIEMKCIIGHTMEYISHAWISWGDFTLYPLLGCLKND